ncbi:MAG TPA: hypothetical protein ENH00_14555 [Actinobacteria bacterium]|nr:hypothetical protein BMS3Bbin01_01689 [bacterium BMS3Bbin01]HDH27388.1 hypothetical protein [Actinomycetota bacterium]
MPRRDVRQELLFNFDVRHFAVLKGRWGTSIAALLRRARDLGVMEDRTYVSAMKTLSGRGWCKHGPGDLGPPEAPSLPQTAIQLAENHGARLETVVQDVGLPMD